MKKFVSAVWILFVCSSFLFAADLETYQATYDKRMGDIVLEHGMKMTEVNQQYSKFLKSLLEKVRRTGDLDKTTEVAAEISSIEKNGVPMEGTINATELEIVRAAYIKKVSAYEEERANKIVSLVSKYDNALDRLQKQFVISNQMDDAKAIQTERRNVESSPEVKSATLIMFNIKNNNTAPVKPTAKRKNDVARVEHSTHLADFAKRIEVVSAGFRVGDQAKIVKDGDVIVDVSGAEISRGISMACFHKGKVVLKDRFDTWIAVQETERFYDTIKELPTGCFVVLAVSDDATRNFTSKGQKAINQIGGKDGLYKQPYRTSYICIGQKGLARGKAIEISGSRLLRFPK